MAITIQIAGVDRTNVLMPNTLSFADTLNARNTMQFELKDVVSGYQPNDGEEVILFDGATRLYAGILFEPSETIIPGATLRRIACSAVGYELIADRHLVRAVYENKTVAFIVSDILTTDLAGEGITAGTIDTGPTIIKIVFNYRKVSDVYNELSELSGFAWWIDENKVLQFRSRESIIAPVTITELNALTMTIQPSRDRYRNRQFVRAGVDLTDSRTESFVGDGTRRTWNVSFPVGKAPTAITVNAAGKTIGIRGVDTGKDFYWNKSKTEISQDDGGTLLTSTDTLAVTYQGEFPIIVQAEDDVEIATRKAIEGGTGEYESVDDDPNINDDEIALDKATAKLSRYGNIPTIVNLETNETGLRAGQLLPIHLPLHGLNSNFLIDAVQGIDIEGQKVRFRVTALGGDAIGGWQAYFRALQVKGQQFVLRENEVLLLLRKNTEEVFTHDSLHAFDTAPETRVGFAKIDSGEVG